LPLLHSDPFNQHLKPNAADGRSLERKTQLADFCQQLLQDLIAISLY
jgi:hypothetical protein